MARIGSRGRAGQGILLFAGWVTLFTGCQTKDLPIGDVVGSVDYKGKPVTAGFVRFYPEAGGVSVAGAIGADGTYRASGVPVGRCKVTVETRAFKNRTAPPPKLAKEVTGPQPLYVAIPQKYESPESSGQTFEVKAKGQLWKVLEVKK